MKRDLNKDAEVVKRWLNNPLDWVLDMFGDNLRIEFKKLTGFDSTTRTGLTVQQESAFIEFGKVIRSKLLSHFGEKLSEKESEYASKIGMSIMSGTGTGKDFFAALVLLYFMCCFKNSRCTATANTAKQLRNVLWAEISKAMSLSRKMSDEMGSPTMLQEIFVWQSEKVYVKQGEGKEWFVEGVTIGATTSHSEEAEAIAGRHEKYTLMLADEASAIPEGIFKAMEGTLTGVVNLILVIFNPTRATGFAVESATKDKRFVQARWDSRDSEIVKKSHTDGLIEKYGIDSNPARIRVLGLPPLSDDDSLIPWDWIEDARMRALEPVDTDMIIKGADFGAGGDKSVICTRKGGVVYPFKRNNTKDSNELVDWVYSDFLHSEADMLAGDVIGIGYHVVGDLKKRLGSEKVRAVDSRSRASSPRFSNKRAENYWNLREVFEDKSISLALLPEDDYRELSDQLGATKYTIDNGIRIIKKEKIKKEVGHSPDEGDALANTYAFPNMAVKKIEKPKPRLLRRNTNPYAWMA